MTNKGHELFSLKRYWSRLKSNASLTAGAHANGWEGRLQREEHTRCQLKHSKDIKRKSVVSRLLSPFKTPVGDPGDSFKRRARDGGLVMPLFMKTLQMTTLRGRTLTALELCKDRRGRPGIATGWSIWVHSH